MNKQEAQQIAKTYGFQIRETLSGAIIVIGRDLIAQVIGSTKAENFWMRVANTCEDYKSYAVI